MKLVIELDKVAYDLLTGKIETANIDLFSTLIQSVQSGTLLPKGHGRLIDADKLDGIMYHKAFETDSDMQKWDSGCWIRYKMFENSMKEMSTIIEADREDKE